MSRALPQVKNRAPAPIQITAEQLIKEAQSKGLEDVLPKAKQYITDSDELQAYQLDKRKDFESQVQRHRQQMGVWCRYALWEAGLKEYDRARSIFERALQFNYKDEMTWSKYGEMEMKAKFINHARNVWDRATTLLPRVNQFWFKYTYMEELVESIALARAVFERWMQWEPEDAAWEAYVKFEMRQGDIARARAVQHRYVACHSTPSAFLKFARWEERNGNKAAAREVYERAVDILSPDLSLQGVFAAFGLFEERCQEFERARMIYAHAVLQGEQTGLPADELSALRASLVAFEKRHGSKSDIEEAILHKRREQYEAALSANPRDFDTWLDLARLEEAEGNAAAVRAVYERAVQHMPPVLEKLYWRRYMYLWLCWALYEEIDANDASRARDVYKKALAAIPHKKFTFGKMWVLAAELEVRCMDLSAARKVLGVACGKCGHLRKPSIYRKYIALEQQMGEVDRCRAIYSKWLETMPEHCAAWVGMATLEAGVGESDRARAIYELATQQDALDTSDALWKAYIDFESDEGLADNVRTLYKRLLERTGYAVRVFVASALFEVNEEWDTRAPDKPLLQRGGIEAARNIFQQGYDVLKAKGLKEERVQLLNAWRDVELRVPGGHVAAVEAKLPRKVKLRRAATDEMGQAAGGWEEYYDYLFPDDEQSAPGLKLLENALKWKAAAAAAAAAAVSDNSHSSDHIATNATMNSNTVSNVSLDENCENSEESSPTALGKRKADNAEEIDIDV
jgi:crooked neck